MNKVIIHVLQNLSHTYTMASIELVVTNQERCFQVGIESSDITGLAHSTNQIRQGSVEHQ